MINRLSFPLAAALSPLGIDPDFPPTMHKVSSVRGRVRMIPPPHSGAEAAAPERRGGIAAERRWAGVPRLGPRRGGNT